MGCVSWRLGHCDDVEVGGRIGLQVELHHRVPKKLVEPGSQLFGGTQYAPAFDLAKYSQQILAGNLEHRHLSLAKPWQHVLGENPVDLREGALALFFQALRLEVARCSRCSSLR
jgi:hypothetical protein